MLIRSEQMRAMEQYSVLAFENRMLERIRTYFPKPAELLGDSQLRVIVRLANAKSQSHLLTHERSVALYLDLMLVLGSGFDTDPQIPWAAEILADRHLQTQAERIDLLHDRGWEYGRKISPDFENPRENRSRSCLIEGMVEIRHKALDELTPAAAKNTAADIVARLQDLFPCKAASIGPACVSALVARAFDSAAKYGIRSERGVWLFAALMFVLGSAFDSDPQFPWALAALTDSNIADPVTRTQRLYADARGALKRWWGVGSIDPGRHALL